MKGMLALPLACYLALVVIGASSQVARAARLFIDPQFGWTVHSNVSYGSNVDGNNNPVTLLADIYEPTGVNAPHGQPAIVLMHGGAFAFGSKTSSMMVALAEAFAARGYVAMSINYRLLADLAPPPGAPLGPMPRPAPWHADFFVDSGVSEQQYMNSVAAAIEDHATSFSWLVANAATYNVNPDWLASGGYSAGAVSSLALTTGGVVDGITYPDLKAVFSVAGAMYGYEAGQFDASAPGVYFVHGDLDTEAPFAELGYLQAELDGAGVPYEALVVPGADHTSPLLGEAMLANQDAIFEFMAGQIGVPEPSSIVLLLVGGGAIVGLAIRNKGCRKGNPRGSSGWCPP